MIKKYMSNTIKRLVVFIMSLALHQTISACYIGPDDAQLIGMYGQEVMGYCQEHIETCALTTGIIASCVTAHMLMPEMYHDVECGIRYVQRGVPYLVSRAWSLAGHCSNQCASVITSLNSTTNAKDADRQLYYKICATMPARKAKKVCALQCLSSHFPKSSKKERRALIALLQEAQWNFEETESLVHKRNPKLHAMLAVLSETYLLDYN